MKLKKEDIKISLIAIILTNFITKFITDPIVRKAGIPDYNILYDGIFNWINYFYCGFHEYLFCFRKNFQGSK